MIGTESTIQSALMWATGYLFRQSLESPGTEARAILSSLMKWSPTSLYLNFDTVLPVETIKNFQAMVERRGKREPVAYILGVKNFYGLDFLVNESTLIPRPETELLVEQAVEILKIRRTALPARESLRILDVGTGSGCIAVAIAREVPEASVAAVDMSTDALDIARKNAARNGVTNATFLAGDLYAALSTEGPDHFDMIVSNPPYIAASEFNELEPDLSYEPLLALDGGIDGLSCIRRLVREGLRYLKPSGSMLVEIGTTQGPAVKKLFEETGFVGVGVRQDYARHDRIVSGDRRGSV